MKTAIVLSGGGARGAFEAGVIAAFEDAGVDVDVITGTSAGAINATAMAIGMPAEDLMALWCGLRNRDVYRVRIDIPRFLRPLRFLSNNKSMTPTGLTLRMLESVGWTWLLDTAPLRELLHDQLGRDRVAVLPNKVLTVVSVEAVTGRITRFTSQPPRRRADSRYRVVDMTIDHVLASAAIPVLFRPVEIDGGVYWDGGIGANTPLGAALGYDPDVCFVVATGAVDRMAARPKTLSESLSLLVDDLLTTNLTKELEGAERVNQLIRAMGGHPRYKEVEFHLISPPAGMSAGVADFLDFEGSSASVLIAQGRKAAETAIARFRRLRAA